MSVRRGIVKGWKCLRLLIGLNYQCRCGAIMHKKDRQRHEEFHLAIRKFYTGPTPDEIAAFRAQKRQP